MHPSAFRSTDGESYSHADHSLHTIPALSSLQTLGGVTYITGVATLAKPLFMGNPGGYALGVFHEGLGENPLELIAVREVPDPGVGALANWLVSVAGRVSEEAGM
jgi:hypothetical protein